MKISLSKSAIIAAALIVSAFSLALVSVNFSSVGIQDARVLLSTDSRKLPKDTARSIPNTPISGRYMIGVTIKEDFLNKGSEKIIQKIFINGKGYEFTANNLPTEITHGFYDIKGTINIRTNKATLSSAKFSGSISDENIEDNADPRLLSLEMKKNKKKVAVFLFDYLDSSTQPFYPSTVHEMVFGNGKFKSYFKEASYDRLIISGDTFGWYTIPQNSNNGTCQAGVETDLASAISGSSIDLNNYGNIVIISLCNGQVANGQSNMGPQPYNINGMTYNKTVSWVNISENNWDELSDQMMESMAGPHVLTNLERLLTHEFGHALGLYHAHGMSCVGILPTAECEGVGVGNIYDTMAYDTIGLHMNAWTKAKLGWFNNLELKTITQSGVYSIGSIESQPVPGQISSAPKAYKIKPSANSTKTPIWIEFRKATGFDGGINTPALGGIQGGGGEAPPHNVSENQNGIMIYKEGFEAFNSGMLNPPSARLMYLRGAPNLSNGSNPYQVSLNPGETYSEPRYGLSITTLPAISPALRKFEVTMDPNFACTHVPPSVQSWQLNNAPVSAGTSTFINNLVVNMDYLSCPSTSFTYDFDFGQLQQNGNTSNLASLLSNLSPDDERRFLFGVFVPTGTTPGIYEVGVTITNSLSGLSTTETVPLTVQ